jgi:hypothetical protein
MSKQAIGPREAQLRAMREAQRKADPVSKVRKAVEAIPVKSPTRPENKNRRKNARRESSSKSRQ